ncbi:MAG TPA: VTT domain-containing protein [Desulfomonilaceae bacterium]|nr:VTT domain-containing protein [Desulfomonilaceae bacterium]
MKPVTKEDKRRLILAVSLLGTGLAALGMLSWMGLLTPIVDKMWQIFQGREQLRAYVESWGGLAPAVFVFIQALQVVIAPIPGELTGAVGGFVFGALPNVMYSTVGLTIGTLIAFIAARVVGYPLVKLFVSQETMDKFHFLTERRGTCLALVLFTIPGFPKDILAYILGISPMGFVPFAVVSTIGRLPGTILLSFSGSAVYDEDWTVLALLCVSCALVFAGCYLARGRFEYWLNGKSKSAS